MEIAYHLLGWTCVCGHSTKEVRVGTTSHGFLIGKWTCSGCFKEMLAMISLKDLIAGIPSPPEEKKLLTAQTDSDFLKAFHISED